MPDGTTGTLTGPVTDTGITGALDVAETWTYNISYPVSQSIIDAGAQLINSVEVTTNETPPLSDTAETDITRTPSFTVAKVVDQASVSVPGALNYAITIENTGNVTLTNVIPQDQLSNGNTLALIGPTNDIGVSGALDVGESWQYTASYSVSQADVDTGTDLTNTVSVVTDETGTDPQTASAVTTIDAAPNMQVAKTVDLASISAPGTLNYVIDVINTGNVSLNNVALVDTLPDGTTAVLTGPLTDTGVAGSLDVGETWQYTTSYQVSQADIDDGRPRDNNVSVTSDETGSNGFTATATTTINAVPDFTLEKTVDQAQISEPGLLTYSIAIENVGNITLTDIQVEDTLPDGSSAVLAGPTGDIGIAGSIDVGETWTFNATYSATQADVNSGVPLINNVSVVTAEAGAKTDSAETTISQVPAISIVKTAIETEFVLAGDVINYAFLVSNTGNLLLNNVIVSDPIACLLYTSPSPRDRG